MLMFLFAMKNQVVLVYDGTRSSSLEMETSPVPNIANRLWTDTVVSRYIRTAARALTGYIAQHWIEHVYITSVLCGKYGSFSRRRWSCKC